MSEQSPAATKTAKGVKTSDPKLTAITRIKKLIEPLQPSEKSIVLRYLYEDYREYFPTAE